MFTAAADSHRLTVRPAPLGSALGWDEEDIEASRPRREARRKAAASRVGRGVGGGASGSGAGGVFVFDTDEASLDSVLLGAAISG